MTDDNKIHDLEDDVALYLGAAFSALAGRPANVEILAKAYTPPRPNNMTKLVATLRKDGGDRNIDHHAAKIHYITQVLTYARGGGGAPAFFRDDATDKWTLADGVDLDTVRYGDQLLIQPRRLPDLFHPETGAWRNGTRR